MEFTHSIWINQDYVNRLSDILSPDDISHICHIYSAQIEENLKRKYLISPTEEEILLLKLCIPDIVIKELPRTNE